MVKRRDVFDAAPAPSAPAALEAGAACPALCRCLELLHATKGNAAPDCGRAVTASLARDTLQLSSKPQQHRSSLLVQSLAGE